MTMLTLPFGYHEGLNRKLSNRWKVKWQDFYLPMSGNISMNLSSVDSQDNEVAL